MTGARSFLAVVVCLFTTTFVAPAAAHALKLFVTVDDLTISGHGFFVGGGRPQGVVVKIRDAGGHDLFQSHTDSAGGFAWTAPAGATYVVALDTGDGHFVETTVPAERFLAAAPSPVSTSAPSSPTPVAAAGEIAPDAAALKALIETSVDRALARRLTPLVEAQERSETRLRFADVMGGIGMIVGLAGLSAWAMARRRERGGPGA